MAGNSLPYLTPFEYYYYLDDRPEYPTTFPVELRFTGLLEPERFRRALKAAVARHPLLMSRLDDRGRWPRWVPDETRLPAIEWAPLERSLGGAAGGPLDLRRETGLRTWVRADDRSARVVFEFHHACCDGLASLQFVQDFLALYRADAEGQAAAVLRPLDAQLLLRRGELGADIPPRTRLQRLWDAWFTFRVWSILLRRTPVVLEAPPDASASAGREPLAFDVAVLTPDESTRLRRKASLAGTTTNDLLLRDLLLVLRQWIVDHQDNSAGLLRINVPVSVRSRSDIALPVANRIGYGFVTAAMQDATDSERLLQIVREETTRIKEWKLALYFLGGMAFASQFPGILKWAMRRPRSFATAVLSNVGRFTPEHRSKNRHEPWRYGDLTLDWIGGVPPVRPLTRAALIVIDYAGRTSICLRTDPHVFDAKASQQLLDRFVARLRQTVAQ